MLFIKIEKKYNDDLEYVTSEATKLVSALTSFQNEPVNTSQ